MISTTQASGPKRVQLKWSSPHGRPLPSPEVRTLIMGVLNITPNSFSGDGLLNREQDALDQADAMINVGIDVLDIGGVPTRPPFSEKVEEEKPGKDHFPVHHSYSYTVSEDEEMERILPIIKAVRKKHPKLPISADTTRARVAKACIEAGADIINDQKSLLEDVNSEELNAFKKGEQTSIKSPMGTMLKELQCPVILMHNRSETAYKDFWKEILEDLTLSLSIAKKSGIQAKQIWVDPGFCFGKEVRHNLEMVKNIDRLHALGTPILLGASRKSTLGGVTGAPIDQRIAATITTTLWAQSKGVHMVRVHDAFENHQALQTFHAINQGINYHG